LGKGVRHNSETTNSAHRSAEAPPAQLNATWTPSIEANSGNDGRWVERCNIGIEIGDDYCRVAMYDFIRQEAVPIKDEFRCIDIPTCVAFTRDEILVGSAAQKKATYNLDDTFLVFTCLFGQGRAYWGRSAINYKAYRCANLRQRGHDLLIFVSCRQRHFTVVELKGIPLEHYRELAEVQCSKASKSFCITASFSNSCSTLGTLAEAAEAAGIGSPKIMSCGVAIACDYLIQQQVYSTASFSLAKDPEPEPSHH
jgi:molecular chaperone DnaK (HSP70)